MQVSIMSHPHLDERVLCGDEWKVEALGVIHDVQDHVFEIEIADGSVNNDQLLIHLVLYIFFVTLILTYPALLQDK